MSNSSTPRPGLDISHMPEHSTEDDGRLMQIKVLYTFDENKTNCLTRCPLPLSVRTACLDASTQIGIIQLQDCVHTVLQASPELLATIGQDYTVYAYDYSEYETPLVGCGRLSTIVSASIPTPPTIVTGVVRNNLFGLFSGGVSETLEVKLKLVPVPSRVPRGYVRGMDNEFQRHEELGANGMDNPSSFGANSGSDVPPHRQLSSIQARNERSSFSTDTMGLDRSMLGKAASLGQPSRPNSRAGDAVFEPYTLSNDQFSAPNQRFLSTSCSRPASRTSVRNSQQIYQPLPQPQHSLSQNVDHDSIDISSTFGRKRVPVVQANWSGPSALDMSAEPLRIKASSAAMMRGRRISLAYPTGPEFPIGDASMRPPTPRPHTNLEKKRTFPRSNTGLAQEVITHRSADYRSPYPSNVDGSDYIMTSPEAPSTVSTPFDIPSSPPVLHHESPAPSSPSLPSLRLHPDSGFVSGTLEECIEYDNDDEMRPLDEDDIQVLARYSQRPVTKHAESLAIEGAQAQYPPAELIIRVETPGDPSLLPRKILPRPPGHPHQPPVPNKRRPAKTSDSSPRLRPQRRTSKVDRQIPVPAQGDVPMSETGLPQLLPTNSASTSETFGHDFFSEAMSGTEGAARPGLKRKRAIQSNLATCLSTGLMPPYCKNCGEVNTPTWRKAYTRIEEGSPHIALDKEEEEAAKAWEVLGKNTDGLITSHRVFLKTVKREDRKNYEELQLCNPCGIWLWKNLGMRPPEVWVKANARDGEPPKKRASRRKVTPSTEAQDSCGPTDAAPARPALSKASGGSVSESDPMDKPWNTNLNARSVSLGPDQQARTAKAAALRRGVQSSPPQAFGSKHKPIELDTETSPKPTRRLIFPSPRRSGEVKSLDVLSSNGTTGSATLPEVPCFVSRTEEDTEDKENKIPATVTTQSRDISAHQLEDDGDRELPRTPKCSALGLPLKTPTPGRGNRILTPNGFLSSAAKRWRDAAQTPHRSGSRAPGENALTPFTVKLVEMLSQQAPSDGVEMDHSTMSMFIDTMGSDADAFQFSDFSTDANIFGMELGSLDHSFSLYEDPGESSSNLWNSAGPGF